MYANDLSEASSGRRVALNSILNLVTGVAIIALNIAFVPALIRSFGTELFSVLSVTWMILANLAWLDLGFSRAAARFVAQELAISRPDKAAIWAWTAILTQLVLGAVGAAGLYVLAPRLTVLLQIDPHRRELVTLALRLFAFSIPLDLATRSLSGVLQARQRFGWLNALNIAGTFWTFGAYGLGILRDGDFLVVIVGLFTLRFANLAAMAWGAVRVLPELKRPTGIIALFRDYRANARTMVGYGWWLSLTSLLGALLLYFDQWMIGVIIGAAILPFYTVPMGILGRLAIFSSSVTSTLFPAFSALHASRDWGQIEQFFIRSHRYILAILTPVMFLIFVWGHAFLWFWISPRFAVQATIPLQILCLGMIVGLLAPISGSLIEAIGKPEIVAKLYMIEVPVNFALVYAFTKAGGVTGAAWSFSLRTVLETIVLLLIVYRMTPFSLGALLKRRIAWQAATVIGMTIIALFLAPRSHVDDGWTIVASAVALLLYGLATRSIFPDEHGLLVLKAKRRVRAYLGGFIDTAAT